MKDSTCKPFSSKEQTLLLLLLLFDIFSTKKDILKEGVLHAGLSIYNTCTYIEIFLKSKKNIPTGPLLSPYSYHSA